MSNRYIYHNPNREGKHVGDCVIRALSTVLHLDWNETFLRLSMLAYEMADMPDSNVVWGRFLNLYGFVVRPVVDVGVGPYAIYEFCLDHPYGEYILCTGTHVVSVIDGYYYDTGDTGDEQILFYYERGSYI